MGAAVLLVVFITQATPEEYVKAAITFPSDDEVRVWTEKGAEYKAVLNVVLDRARWVKAVKEVGERVAPLKSEWLVTVKLQEWGGTSVARADRAGNEGTVVFNMRRLGEYERKLEEYRKQAEALRKQNKRMVWKVPPVRYDRILHHELTHIVQGEYKSPGWLHEGLASWVGNDMNYVVGFAHARKPVEGIEVDLSADSDDEYGRGMMFFEWLESRIKGSGIRAFVSATVVAGGDWKKALEEATGLSWDKIVKVEQEWSAAYCRKHTPSE